MDVWLSQIQRSARRDVDRPTNLSFLFLDNVDFGWTQVSDVG